jgi:hypothetical protein
VCTPTTAKGLAGVLAREELEVDQDVQAVDAAVAPEIEQHEPPGEVLRQRQRPRDVEPALVGAEIRRADADGGVLLEHFARPRAQRNATFELHR